jgi:hypothetical protein
MGAKGGFMAEIGIFILLWFKVEPQFFSTGV